MERLTTRQIADFNNPLAFARSRGLWRARLKLDQLSTNRPPFNG